MQPKCTRGTRSCPAGAQRGRGSRVSSPTGNRWGTHTSSHTGGSTHTTMSISLGGGDLWLFVSCPNTLGTSECVECTAIWGHSGTQCTDALLQACGRAASSAVQESRPHRAHRVDARPRARGARGSPTGCPDNCVSSSAPSEVALPSQGRSFKTAEGTGTPRPGSFLLRYLPLRCWRV